MGHVYFYPSAPSTPDDASRPTSKRRSQNAGTWLIVEGELSISFTPNLVVPLLKGKSKGSNT
jgi:hypothetical protein